MKGSVGLINASRISFSNNIHLMSKCTVDTLSVRPSSDYAYMDNLRHIDLNNVIKKVKFGWLSGSSM